MRGYIRFYPLAILALLSVAVRNADAAVLMGIQTTSPGTLWDINPATAAAPTTVGPTGVGLIEGALAFTSGGILFGAWQNSGGKNLVTLNTVTGAATTIGPMTGSDDVSALTFGKDGKLYALDSKVNIS